MKRTIRFLIPPVFLFVTSFRECGESQKKEVKTSIQQKKTNKTKKTKKTKKTNPKVKQKKK